MTIDVEIKDDREKAVSELLQRVEQGKAFLIWASGMTKKQQIKLEKLAIKGLKLEKTFPKLHVIKMECGKEFAFVEN